MKRKNDSLLRANGHKLQPIADTDTGWVRCTGCARTVGGMSDKYWSSHSCNRKTMHRKRVLGQKKVT